MVTFIIIFMFDIFTSCCLTKNTLRFKKELYVVVVKVRAIVLRKIQHNWRRGWDGICNTGQDQGV